MKKMKKFLIASMCIAATGALIAPVTGAIMSGKATDTPSWDEINLASEYVRDDTIVIPERDLTVDGNTYDAVIKLQYPSGEKRLVESGEFTLAQPGLYTLIYEAKDENSVTYTEEQTFVVSDKLWSVSNSKSSVAYGTAHSSKGLIIKLAKNDVLKFNRIIDITDLDSTDTLIGGFINPETVGSYEFSKLVFTLTDAEDPTQTLKIRGCRSTTNNSEFASYWNCAGTGQLYGGWDSNGLKYNYQGNCDEGILGKYSHNVSFNSCNGKYDNSPKGCYYYPVAADQCSFKIAYDKEDVRTYVNGEWVSDLNDGEYHANEPTWEGFPSGKVFLSVEAEDCTGDAANIVLTNIFGYDLTMENKFVETDDPIIKVDVEDRYVKEQSGVCTMIPTAVVGYQYPVSKATAYDSYAGDLDVDVSVYHNYSNETGRTERAVKNGVFNVDKAGTYAIVYSATDHMGNTAEKIYWVNAVKQLDNPLTVVLDQQDVETEGVCGETIAVAPYEVTGGSGDVELKITATCGDVTLDATKGKFIPEVSGDWTVEYFAKDYAGCECSVSYTVTIENGTVPLFVGEPLLPKFMISNLNYNVPTIKAHDYSTGEKKEIIADMILVDANGETRYAAGESFVPVVTEEGTDVTLKFVAGTAEYIKTVPALMPLKVASNGRTSLYIEKLFVGDNFTAERTKHDGLVIQTTEAGDSEWLFANAVVSNSASLTVKGIQGKSNFSAMEVTFTDYEDDSISVTMRLENQANGFAKINFSGYEREMTKGFNLGKDTSNGEDLDVFTFSYKLGYFYVDKFEVAVTKDDNGNAFNGFPSGRVYISTKTTGAQEGAQYSVKQFDNHIMGSSTVDRTPPRIAIVGEYGGLRDLNTVYSIAPALASDTVDANISATVSVRTPSGELVKDVNGLLLENVPADKYYDVLLTEYGQYKVQYKAVDYTNAVGEIEHTINVFDEKAPTMVVADTWSATAKVGDTVALPELYVMDDNSSVKEMKVIRYVRNPYDVAITFGLDYEVTEFGEVKYYTYTFTFNNVGEYRFINVVYDAAGNQKIVEYTVTVEA